jgi:hypothetical protein
LFMSPSAFPDAMERDGSINVRSETPVGDHTPRDQEERKDQDARNDSEIFVIDS